MIGLMLALLAGSVLWLLRAEWLPYSPAKTLNTSSPDGWLVVVCILLLAGILVRMWFQRRAAQQLDSEGISAPPLSEEERQMQPQHLINGDELKRHLQRDGRWRWKHRHAWLLVTGASSLVEQIAPGLTSQGWLRCGNAILLWGGDIIQEGNQPDLKVLRAMRGHRPVDALVHVADDTVQSASRLDALQSGMWSVQQALRWQPPVYRLEVANTQWPQDITAHPLVAVLSGPAFTAAQLRASLAVLADNMIMPGMQYVTQDTRHDYLLRLSAQLKQGGVERLLNVFHVFQDNACTFRLHGVLFTPPLVNGDTGFLYQQRMGAVWRGIAGHSARLPGKSTVLDARTIMFWCLSALLALWGAGMMVSWCGNVSLLRHTQTLLSASSPENERQLGALQAQLRTLVAQQQTGTPWYRRFGLDISGNLPPHLWPEYVRQARAQIALPAQRALEQRLASATADPLIRYDYLKALLMLSQPERVNNAAARAFLTGQLKTLLPRFDASHLAWFVSQLHAHPTLRITPDARLIQQTRLSLAESMNDAQAEAKRYRVIINQARLSYADVSLSQLGSDADLADFYQSAITIPGAFTRNAWEALVRPAIEQQVKALQEQTAWVLGPQQGALSPDAVRQRLRARYFTDYAAAWQQMLNQITYTSSRSNSEQLARLADPNRSPLLALMHQLSWQGLADSPDEARGRVNDFLAPVFSGLVDMEKGLEQGGRNGITLRQWLSQAARLRDRLRKIDAASGNTFALTTSVFQGTQLDNTAAELPERIQAQLGKALAPAGNALFVAPVSYAWKGVMQQGLSRINSQWQQTIVNDWHRQFDNTYPFSNVQTDSNLAELGEFIRPGSGKIPQFINQNLKGVLEYRNNRWQVAAKLLPGLIVNPAFLAALNRLNNLGVMLFDKHSGVTFRLQPGTAHNVVKTHLFIDGQVLEYFNQMPFWQTVHWPGETYKPGASLKWNSLNAGARLYGDLSGQWGFIRLLEKARVTPQGNNRYRLTWTAPDGLSLNYLLDATAQQNPLDILLLKGFRLPDAVFTVPSATRQMQRADNRTKI